MIRRFTRGWSMAFLACALTVGVAEASAPPGRYTAANGTVKDNRTGLIWQQTVDSGTYTQPAAITYCNNLRVGGFSSGWRLPTIQELLSITDRTVAPPGPTIDTNAFPNTQAEAFWSVSAYVGAAGYAWLVDFSLGGSIDADTTNGSNRVRCVR